MLLPGGVRNAAVWTAGRVAGVIARVSYAMVEGCVFALSRQSAALVVAAELAAFTLRAGVRAPLKVAAGTLLAAGTLRTCRCLFMSFRGTSVHHIQELTSIWEWEPPSDDHGASSAWHILRQLASTANKLREDNPAVQHLLDQPALAANELAMRLYYYYLADDEPMLSPADMAQLAEQPAVGPQQAQLGAEAGGGGGEGAAAGGEEDEEGGKKGSKEGGTKGAPANDIEGGKKGGKEGGTEGGKKGGKKGGTEGGKKGGKDGKPEGSTEGSTEDGAEGGAEDSTEDGAEGGTEGGTEGGAGDQRVAPVSADLKAQIESYRDFVVLPYYYTEDQTLSKQLKERGYRLLCASHAADLGSGCPAYFLCLSEKRQEVALVVRGTFSAEDAFFDLLATGAAFDEENSEEGGCDCPVASAGEAAEEKLRMEGFCHSGIGKGALFLGAKFGALLHALWSQGYRITLVGHSLGAGVASLLAVYLRNRGMGPDRLHCWAYETPACMDLDLALACTDLVTSIVNCDDCIPRLSIRSFARFLEELAAFDWQAEAESHAAAADWIVTEHLSKLLLFVFGALASGDKDGQPDEKNSPGGGEEKEHSAGSGSGDGKEHSAGSGSGDEKEHSAGSGSGDGKEHAIGSHAINDDGTASTDVGAAAKDTLHAAAEKTGQMRPSTSGFEQKYNAHVPGRVVLVFRPPGSGLHGSEEAGKQDGLALVATTHRAVRRLRISSCMLTDHFVDKPEVMAALGGCL